MDQTKTFLMTVHGTLIWFDEKTNLVRHAPPGPGSGAENSSTLTLQKFGGGSVLAFETANGPAETIDGTGADGRLCRVAAGAPLVFKRHNLPDGLIALEANGLFLCAEVDGTLSLTRTSRGPWELYAELDEAELDWLSYVTSHAWLSATRDAAIPRDMLRPIYGFRMQLGDIVVPLAGLLNARHLATVQTEAKSFTLIYDGWKVEELTEYNPLIYMAAFGKDEIFACLNLALQALREFGRYEGDILLFTDRTPDRLAGVVPRGMERQIRLAAAPANDMLDFNAARYRICELQEAANYRPALYLDTDVICDRPVDGVLREILRAGRLCVALEFDLLGSHDFYGASLFAHDPTARPRDDRGFSAGLIGVPNMAIARRSFPAILATLYAQARLTGNRHFSNWYDQPSANYVLHKTDAADFAVMTPRVVTPVDLKQPIDAIPRRGFAHFSGGVGNTAVKLPAMRAYLELLRQQT